MDAELRRLVLLVIQVVDTHGEVGSGGERMITLAEKEPLSYWTLLEYCDDFIEDKWITWGFQETPTHWIFGRLTDGSVLRILRPPGEPLADAPGSDRADAV
jgi:hypothetical protein